MSLSTIMEELGEPQPESPKVVVLQISDLSPCITPEEIH